MKIALVHDYLVEYGGAEMVLEDLHQIFPEAPIYVFYLYPHGLGIHYQRIKNWDIKTSWYQKMPFARKFLSASRVIAPFVFEGFDLSDFDVVISSCNTHFAKAVITKPESLHISYIHTPPKMLYGYTTSFNYKKHLFTKIAAELANHFLRIWDFEISQRPDILVANSKNVQARIKKFYRRESEIIYPGVDIEEFGKAKKTQGEYFLALNRLMRGKGTEIIIEACSRLNLSLKVAGSGHELETLRKIAGKNVEFLGAVTEEEKIKLLAGAKALIVATEQEDFGITPVEAQAAGTPVIAARSGGYLETVVEGDPSKDSGRGATGEFFEISPDLGESRQYVDEQSVNNLIKVLEKFSSKGRPASGWDPKKYDPEDCRKQAEKFGKVRFKREILDLIEKNLKK
ncbi:MAG: glycosyltransferase [Candidatus Daviesbacteria bacterium]